jgi:hypothetical protein
MTPKHIRSLTLRAIGLKPPFVEDVCVLLPAEQVLNRAEAYLGLLELLKESGVIQAEDLVGFAVLVEDELTLAYPLSGVRRCTGLYESARRL